MLQLRISCGDEWAVIWKESVAVIWKCYPGNDLERLTEEDHDEPRNIQ
jgi:hypothetical protein